MVTVISPRYGNESGLVVSGDAKALTAVDFNQDGRADFFISRNNSSAVAFQNQMQSSAATGSPVSVQLIGPASNPSAVGAKGFLFRDDGSQQSAEVYAGSGYLYQSTPVLFLSTSAKNKATEWLIRWPDGKRTKHPVGTDSIQTLRRDPGLPIE